MTASASPASGDRRSRDERYADATAGRGGEERGRVVLYVMLEEEATILDATGRASGWQFRILFPEHDSVSATHGFCENNGVDLEFERIFELSDSLRRGQYGLSESQYETIVRAYNDGYYDIPRERNLQELAEDLDVSHQSLSERIRRGHEQLVGNTLRPELETVTNP